MAVFNDNDSLDKNNHKMNCNPITMKSYQQDVLNND